MPEEEESEEFSSKTCTVNQKKMFTIKNACPKMHFTQCKQKPI